MPTPPIWRIVAGVAIALGLVLLLVGLFILSTEGPGGNLGGLGPALPYLISMATVLLVLGLAVRRRASRASN
jgi:hypothetical protein